MAVRGSLKESNQMCLAYEERLYDKKEGRGGRIGCTIVTGFLGCGKTTLLQHILKKRGNLQIAVLVNEFADIDVDSLLLDSSRIMASHGVSNLSLADGCACCETTGHLKAAVRRTLDNKSFDYLVIETSGLANPSAIAKELEETGVRLDLVVTVVDVETLDTILEIPVARQQLEVADIVLINKCDLVSLGMISNAEDRVEEATGGTKAVRCRFANVPLNLVLNVVLSKPTANLASSFANSSVGFLSHEATTPTAMPLLKEQSVSKSPERKPKVMETTNSAPHEHDARISSITFSREESLSLPAFQDFVVHKLWSVKGLLRAKGVVCFEESRSTRHFFHYSGKKRSEAVYGGCWEHKPQTELVFIGQDRRELEGLKDDLLQLLASRVHMNDQINVTEFLQARTAAVDEFSRLVASDARFKLHDVHTEKAGSETRSHTLVMFGLVGSSLQGVHEADLNAALMQTVNGRGVVFLTAATSSKTGSWLQISFGCDLTPDGAWCEIKSSASSVIAKAFQGVCTCRCEMIPHQH